jgi:hypothetical protein
VPQPQPFQFVSGFEFGPRVTVEELKFAGLVDGQSPVAVRQPGQKPAFEEAP